MLFSEDGYTYLDVRPSLEYEDVGRVKGSVNIPMKHSKKVYDSEQKKKVVVKEDNPNFVEQVRGPRQSTIFCIYNIDVCQFVTFCVLGRWHVTCLAS